MTGPGGPTGQGWPNQLPRVVATDLDGTLLRSDGTISERTRSMLVATEEAGTTVLFVTARPPRWVEPLADAVGSHGVVIAGNGAFVVDLARGAALERHRADLFEVEHVRAEHDGHLDGARLEQILTAVRDETAADERDVGGCVEPLQLAHGVADEHLRSHR